MTNSHPFRSVYESWATVSVEAGTHNRPELRNTRVTAQHVYRIPDSRIFLPLFSRALHSGRVCALDALFFLQHPILSIQCWRMFLEKGTEPVVRVYNSFRCAPFLKLNLIVRNHRRCDFLNGVE